MAKTNILVFGSINVDLVTKVNNLPAQGETVFAETFLTENGGKGANQAVSAARLGAKVSMIGRVGSDGFGRQVLRNLEIESINTEMVTEDSDTNTGIALITIDSQSQNTIVVSSGANMTCGVTELRYLEASLAKTDCLILQNEVPYVVNLKAAQLARGKGVQVVWDPAPFVTDTEELINNVDYLTPNQNEAQLLAKCEITDERSIHKALQRIKKLSDAVCLITMGEDGVFFLSGSELTHVPGYEVESVDSVAAGDAFAGGFATALSEGKSLPVAIKRGCASGALATTKIGAQAAMPFRKEVDQLFNSVH
ncbi:MAG: ribokinase [Chloroflexota bacterium]|nr:ribokinase [Chloroflexota bacterium]